MEYVIFLPIVTPRKYSRKATKIWNKNSFFNLEPSIPHGYIIREVGVILHKCKPYDLKCLLGKNITQELNKSIYIYKEHKIMIQVDMKNYGIYENT